MQEKLKKALDATTCNRFFAIRVEGDKGEKLAEHDDSTSDVVCSEEFYMVHTDTRKKMRLFIKSNSDKK